MRKKLFVLISIIFSSCILQGTLSPSFNHHLKNVAAAEKLFQKNPSASSFRDFLQQQAAVKNYLDKNKKNIPRIGHLLMAQSLQLQCPSVVHALVARGVRPQVSVNGKTMLQYALEVTPEAGHEDDLLLQIDDLLCYGARALTTNKCGENAQDIVNKQLRSLSKHTRMHRVYSEIKELLNRSVEFEKFVIKEKTRFQIWRSVMQGINIWLRDVGV